MKGGSGTGGVALYSQGWDAGEADVVELVVDILGETVVGDVGDFLEGPEFSFVGLSGEVGKLGYVAQSGGVKVPLRNDVIFYDT